MEGRAAGGSQVPTPRSQSLQRSWGGPWPSANPWQYATGKTYVDHESHVGIRVLGVIALRELENPIWSQGLALAARPGARLGRRSLRGLKDCLQSGTQGVNGSIIARHIIDEII